MRLDQAESLRLGATPVQRVYLGDQMVWQRPEGPANPILLTQEWDAAHGTTLASGPLIQAGSLAIVRVVHRNGSNEIPAFISDNSGANTWHPVGDLKDGEYKGVIAGGSGDLYMWYSIVQEPFDLLDVAIGGDGAFTRIVFVSEWAGAAQVSALQDYKTLENPSMTGLLPVAEVTTTVPGALVVGALGSTVSTRTFTLVSPGFTAGKEHRAQQSTLIAASRPDLPPGTYGPQWELGGAASTTGLITAAFRPA